jgi:hypothetical protein
MGDNSMNVDVNLGLREPSLQQRVIGWALGEKSRQARGAAGRVPAGAVVAACAEMSEPPPP